MMFLLFTSIPIKECLAIENLTQWWSTEFDFNNPGARSRGIGGAFAAKADDSSAAIANPAGIAQLPGIQAYVEGRFTTWDTREKAWGNDPRATPLVNPAVSAGGPPTGPVTTSQEGTIRFDDITDLSFASISFPVNLAANKIEFNAALFFNKVANNDTETTLPVTFQFLPLLPGGPESDLIEGYNTDIELDIDEFGFSMAKSFFKDKLMVGASVSVMLLDLESTFNTTWVDSAGVNHDPSGVIAAANQSVEIDERDEDVAFRFGVLYRVTDKLMIGGNIQLMPDFDYDTEYMDFLVEDQTLGLIKRTFTDRSGLTIPDVFSLGMSYQVTDNWGVFVEGKYIEYSDLMKGFTSFWLEDLTRTDRGQFDIDDIWETHIGTEYVINVKKMPIALRLGGWYEPAHSLEFDASTVPTTSVLFAPNVGKQFEDLMDGGDDVFHFTAGAGIVINNKLQIDAAADIQDDGNKNTFIMSAIYQF